jgi:tetratricopeptide (TPR) repeat protein
LIVHLHHIAYQPGINLGRFRISATTKPEPLRDENLLQLARTVDGWSRVAAAHMLAQQWGPAEAALRRVSSAPEGLAGPEQLLLALVQQQQGQPALAAQAMGRAMAWGAANPVTRAFLDVAFEVVRPAPGEAAPSAAWLHLRSRWHGQHQRHAEAAADLRLALAQAPSLRLQATDIEALNALAQGSADKGQWTEVRDALHRSLEIDAQPYWEWHRAGLVLAYLGEVERYRQHRATVIERFGSTQDPVTAERIAKLGALLPVEGDALKQLADLADLAVARGTSKGDVSLAQLARGMIEYRQENYGAAERWLRQVLLAPNVGWAMRAPAELVVAMSQQQRGQGKEARETLARAIAQLDKEVPQPGSPAIGASWPDWLVCQVLRREAQGLIEGNKPEPKP